MESNSIYLFDRKLPNEDLWSKNDVHEACLSEMRPGTIFFRSQIESLFLKIYTRQVLKTTGNSKYYSLLAHNSVTFLVLST